MSDETQISSIPQENVVIAFALVIAAGAATALGAVVVFIPRLVQYANRRTLAGALGLSAGVMTYVSFVEILNKSTKAFTTSGLSPEISTIYSTCCFFSGVVFMILLNYFVTWLLGGHHHHHRHDNDSQSERGSHKGETRDTESLDHQEHQQHEEEEDAPAVACMCHQDDPIHELKKVKEMAREMEEHERHQHDRSESHGTDDPHGHDIVSIQIASRFRPPQHVVLGAHEDLSESEHQPIVNQTHDDDDEDDDEDDEDEDEDDEDEDDSPHDSPQAQAKLLRMSINTAAAICLHNFPEGLATFVATLNDPSVGIVLAVAIAIHNIPEGLCVAMPVYYATGSKWKAFGWACLSGISEPIAALVGWLVLANSMSDVVYAILFGMVAGMMVIISVKELLPTAHRYDPEDSVVTYFFMGGMVVIALSLVLFNLPE